MNLNNLRKNINKKDYLFSFIFASSLSLLLFLSNMQVIIILGFFVIAFIVSVSFKQNKREFFKHITDCNNNIYNQIQAYINLHEKIQPKQALFPMQGSAILPDIGNILINYTFHG